MFPKQELARIEEPTPAPGAGETFNPSMNPIDRERESSASSKWRDSAVRALESPRVQHSITVVVLLNAVVLGLETNSAAVRFAGPLLRLADEACLLFFAAELLTKLAVYRGAFWRSGWNIFDLAVVAIAIVPSAGAWAILRSLRVLRVLRLLTVVPQMRKVVAAFLHAIPGLLSVIAVMVVFFYTAAVLATGLFGPDFPEWFGSLGKSLYTLFQIMTLESWSMGIVRPVMATHPWAWAFFIPFIVVATFTILNLFIGIIVSTMQELATMPEPAAPPRDVSKLIGRMEEDLRLLRTSLQMRDSPVDERSSS